MVEGLPHPGRCLEPVVEFGDVIRIDLRHAGPGSGRCYTVAGRCTRSHRLLDLGEKGVYPSYTPNARLQEFYTDELMDVVKRAYIEDYRFLTQCSLNYSF